MLRYAARESTRSYIKEFTMGKQRLLMAAATALALSGCGMFDGMGSNRSGGTSASGDGGNTGTGNEAVAACRGLTGDTLRNCLDRERLNRGTQTPR
ncbi:MAG: hypothetical protein ACT4PS_10425 [Betaproteobacteria bacterium]